MSMRCLTVLASGLATALTVCAGEGVKTVALDAVYATTGQKNVKRMTTAMTGDGKFVEPYGKALGELYPRLRGPARVALVPGKDITAAVAATAHRLGERSDKVQPPLEVPAGESVWLAVYFGTNGSSPPAWTVEAVEIKDRTIRLTYKKGAAFTDDIHHYLAWVPLGKPVAGRYTLQLVDVTSKQATVERSCEVKGKGN
jgi:hypothetical protein